jgi:uncharacterized protein
LLLKILSRKSDERVDFISSFTEISPQMVDYTEPAKCTTRDELAYILPMGVFLLLTGVGGYWQNLYIFTYALKTCLAGVLLVYFSGHYRPISFKYWQLGLIFGIVGIVQWCGVEEFLRWIESKGFFYPKIPGAADPINPLERYSPVLAWGYILIHLAGSTLVVPFMEELFWRDFLWRTLLAPNNFRLAKIGEWNWQPALITLAFFVSVHPQWITALFWGSLITILLLWKKSLGACIVMHATTNFLLGIYILMTGKWYYW